METTGSIKHNKGVSKKVRQKNKFFESAKSKNEEKAVLGTAYFSALFSGCILILKSTGSPVYFIVLHNNDEICIAKYMTKYIANKGRMYYTKRNTTEEGGK